MSPATSPPPASPRRPASPIVAGASWPWRRTRTDPCDPLTPRIRWAYKDTRLRLTAATASTPDKRLDHRHRPQRPAAEAPRPATVAITDPVADNPRLGAAGPRLAAKRNPPYRWRVGEGDERRRSRRMRRAWARQRATWWRWPLVGVLVALALLAHDVAMASDPHGNGEAG